MKPKEQTRLQVLNSLLAEHMTLDQAATLMGVSPRHTRRILADYRKHGAASLSHGHRGRKPANAIPEATRSRVVHLARTVYKGGVCRGLLLKRPCQPSRSHLVAPRGNFRRLPVHKAQKPPKPARRHFSHCRPPSASACRPSPTPHLPEFEPGPSASVTSSPPSSVLSPSIPVHRWIPNGECDFEAQRTDETSGSEQLARGAHDTGPSCHSDGSKPTPHPAHTGGLPEARRCIPVAWSTAAYAGWVNPVVRKFPGCLEYRRLCGVGEPGGSEIPWLPGVPPPMRGG